MRGGEGETTSELTSWIPRARLPAAFYDRFREAYGETPAAISQVKRGHFAAVKMSNSCSLSVLPGGFSPIPVVIPGQFSVPPSGAAEH